MHPFVDENSCPRDGSSKIQRERKWTNGSPGDKGMEVAQGAENCAKIVIANVGNDESTTVDKEVQFEIPLPEWYFSQNPHTRFE